MADWYDDIDDERKRWIEAQHLFFIATAPDKPDGGFPNLSPKGRNLLRVLGPNLVGYVDYPGSGNETAKHTEQNGRVTIMLCSFEATARTMRLYGRGRRVDLDDPDVARYCDAFGADLHPYARQAFFIDVERMQTSCGYSVPKMQYLGDRDALDRWCERKLEPREMVDGMPRPGPLKARVARDPA